MKKTTFILTSIAFFSVFFMSVADAEMMTFVRDYTYQASEVDSKQSSRLIATEQVKRLLLEELGTYLESHTEVTNYQLTKDQVTTLTAGVVKTKIVNEKWDGEKYWMRAKIDADPDEVAKSIDKLRNDKKKVAELAESKKKTDDTMKDMEVLRKDLESDKDNKEKIDKYNDKVRSLKLIEAMADSFKAFTEGKPENAMGSFFDMMKKTVETTPDK